MDRAGGSCCVGHRESVCGSAHRRRSASCRCFLVLHQCGALTLSATLRKHGAEPQGSSRPHRAVRVAGVVLPQFSVCRFSSLSVLACSGGGGGGAGSPAGFVCPRLQTWFCSSRFVVLVYLPPVVVVFHPYSCLHCALGGWSVRLVCMLSGFTACGPACLYIAGGGSDSWTRLLQLCVRAACFFQLFDSR